MQLLRAGLCAAAALAAATAQVYDEDDATPPAASLGSALEFLGDGPTGGATGGATGADGLAASVRDATGTFEDLERMASTGAAATGGAAGGATGAASKLRPADRATSRWIRCRTEGRRGEWGGTRLLSLWTHLGSLGLTWTKLY